MGRFVIDGGRPLFGSVRVSGSKNGALPILFATLLTKDISVIDNFPDIGDTRAALRILSHLGAQYTLTGSTLTVDTRSIAYRPVPTEYTSPLRGSTYLLGSSLGAFGLAEIPEYGGCNFAKRPIDLHLDAIRHFGGEINGHSIDGAHLHPATVRLALPSVGATVNSLLLASCIEGESILCGVACEPHVDCLIDFLISMGAKISKQHNCLCVIGGKLHGGRIRILGDMIEAGTYLCAGIISGGGVEARGFCPVELSSMLGLLSDSGVSVELLPDGAAVSGAPRGHITVTAEPYPGFPTDLQPIIAPLLALCGGSIRDRIFPDRFGYLAELSSFGLRYDRVCEGVILHPSRLISGRGRACDLRGGVALLLAALCAEGESTVDDAQTVLRGYSGLCNKLTDLGANVKIL